MQYKLAFLALENAVQISFLGTFQWLKSVIFGEGEREREGGGEGQAAVEMSGDGRGSINFKLDSFIDADPH